MENLIFYCYKGWLKQREGGVIKQVSRLTAFAIVLLCFLLGSLIAFFVLLGRSIAGNDDPLAILILSAWYVMLCTITSIYCEKYQVNNSKQSIEDYKKYCNEMMNEVFNINGFSEDFIPILIERFSKRSDEIDEKVKLKHDHLNKFMEMLLIPTSALILGALLDKGTSAKETLGFGLSGIMIILLVYAVSFFVLFLYDFLVRLPQEKYKEFVIDLQSVLDFKVCKKADDAATETSTETTSEIPVNIT